MAGWVAEEPQPKNLLATEAGAGCWIGSSLGGLATAASSCKSSAAAAAAATLSGLAGGRYFAACASSNEMRGLLAFAAASILFAAPVAAKAIDFAVCPPGGR